MMREGLVLSASDSKVEESDSSLLSDHRVAQAHPFLLCRLDSRSESVGVVPDSKVHVSFVRHRALIDVANEPHSSIGPDQIDDCLLLNLARNVQVPRDTTSDDVS